MSLSQALNQFAQNLGRYRESAVKPDCERTSLKALKIVVRNFTKHSHHDFYICT